MIGLIEGQLVALKSSPARIELIDTMGEAYADAQNSIEQGTRCNDCPTWRMLNEDRKDAIRLGMLAAVEAAQRLKAARAG